MNTWSRYIHPALLISTLFLLMSCNEPWDSSSGSSSSRASQNELLEDAKILFDWNKQSDESICSILQTSGTLLTVGAHYIPRGTQANDVTLNELERTLQGSFEDAIRVSSREPRLGLLNLDLIDCSVLGEIRGLPEVEFVEPKYLSPQSQDDIFESALVLQAKSSPDSEQEEDDLSINPGLYDPAVMPMSYVDYVRDFHRVAAERMERHGLARIYEEFGYYGQPTVGVAIMDNGVFEDRLDFLAQGQGEYRAEGYYKNFGELEPDGPHPQSTDLYGLMPSIKSMFFHGTRQTQLVYSMAPHINFKSVRASSFVFWFLSSQFQGVVEAILALAEDPKTRIISSSMGTIFHSHEIERAIEYFNAYDKIYVSAGGTSMPYLKDVVRIVFPANLDSTISTTGIQDTQDTGGKYILGKNAHGGLGNDFVVDHSDDSSQTVSTTAGMIGLLWSYNPELTREEIIDILIKSSHFYKTRGRKDEVFGWGKIDMYAAFLEVKKRLN